MTSPLRGGPLRKVSRFLESGDGSAPVANLADCTPARMLSQCACVQALIEREVTHARQLISWADICERRPAARAAAEELEHIALALYPSLTLGQVFTETGLVFTFPLAARYMAQGGPSSPHNPALSDASLPSTDYIASLFAVHRVICLAKGLLSDVRAGRHKYAAHQLALLYQVRGGARPGASGSRAPDAAAACTRAAQPPPLPSTRTLTLTRPSAPPCRAARRGCVPRLRAAGGQVRPGPGVGVPAEDRGAVRGLQGELRDGRCRRGAAP